MNCLRTTCDYIDGMKRKAVQDSVATPRQERPVLQEVALLAGLGETISVRAAKAHLSGLLDLVAEGREIVITSGGTPKARLTPFETSARRKVFGGAALHLRSMPKWKGGPAAEELVRKDRDGRGW